MTYTSNKAVTPFNQIEESRIDIEKFFISVFNISGDPIFVKDDECRLLLVNDAFCETFGLSRDEIIGKTLAEKVSLSERESFLAIDKKVLESGEEIVSEETLTTNGFNTRTIITRKNRLIDANGTRYIVGVIHDITIRKQTETREKNRTKVLERITAGEPLFNILEGIVHVVEQENPEMLCSILLLDGAGKHLSRGVAPSLPDFYNKQILGVAIGKNVGSCGTAAYLNERVIVEDIQNHPYWTPYKELTTKAELGACWSEPIRSTTGKVLGTFAIYHREKNYPTESDLLLIEQTASFASIAIEKKLAEENLKRAASVFTHAHEGIIITDASASIVEVNETFTRITGYTYEDVLGKNPRILQSELHPPGFYSDMWGKVVTKGHWRGEIWNRRKNGEVYPEMLTISAVKDSSGLVQHYVSLSTDITKIKENQGQLERIAHYDLLTNLPNRVLLADRLNQAMVRCKRHNTSLAVAFMDLDGFKAVNDTYGHDAGDKLLISVSSNMKEALRKGDTLARIGGDEFIAILVDLEQLEDCELVLKRLLKSATEPVNVADSLMQVSASIGVTIYPQDGVDAEQLIRHADQAMYIAKQSGKNNYQVFDTAENNAINSLYKSVDNIKLALERNEFVLHFQPKVNMRTGEVIGSEALIRWQHPTDGLIPPLEFLPLIEEQAISLKLGEWVIDSALKQIVEWRIADLNLPISVNISAFQLQQSNFTMRLAELLKANPSVNPSYLELEILETSALQDTNQVSTTMKACQDLGVRFALDDFGTGYSSLTYLKRLPAYMIKIDQSFVRDMLEDTDDLAIVQGVVGLAKAFKREVIAEGVETLAHGAALLELGCELAQGFGIARPMPAGDIPEWIENWQADDTWRLK